MTKEFTQMSITLARAAGCVSWGFTILRVPNTLIAPVAVSKVVPMSPAAYAGLRSGDILVAVNGRPCQGHSLKEISSYILSTNVMTLTMVRPNMLGTPSPQPYTSSPTYHSVDGMTHQVQQMFRPSLSPAPQRSYDPASIQDQEQEVYDQEKMQEQIAIKTSPYRSQAVVSPKPKTKHDHVQGSYLAMQHYADAPMHGMPYPIPYGSTLTPTLAEQQRFHNYVQQVDPHACDSGVHVKMPYNSPIGLYSRDNALDTLQKTSGQQVKLLPDDAVVDGSDFARNLANSPTYRMVTALEKGRDREPSRERLPPPELTREPEQPARPESPRQSASFKHLMHNMVYQGAMV